MTYANVNGLNMYYEIHGGGGRPLVLLHGNLSTIEVDFGRMIPAFAKTRQVIAFEQQGHGHTADIGRPLRIKNWADDTAALLSQLGIGAVDILGYSSARPSRSRYYQPPGTGAQARPRLFLLPAPGPASRVLGRIQGLQAEHLAGRVRGNPTRGWRRARGLAGADRRSGYGSDLPEWSTDTVRELGKPVMVVIGDSDVVRPEHAVAMFRLRGGGVIGDLAGLPAAQLAAAVLPGTHITLVHRADGWYRDRGVRSGLLITRGHAAPAGTIRPGSEGSLPLSSSMR
jgi:pimeloyl-ACP methyl ester carboxylesterase